MRHFLLTALLIFSVSLAHAQSGVNGSTVDSKGEAVPFILVVADSGKKFTTTDFEGKFNIELKPGKHTIVFQGSGYNTMRYKDIVVPGGDFLHLNVVMKSATDLEEVIVVGYLNTDSEEKKNEDQKNNSSVSDGVSGEQIKTRPVQNTSDVLKLVSGAAIQENRFAIVRGLNDRYNAAFLNGAMLPSSESDRKAFSFDIFPANMLDNLTINKTATPDMPAEFAGGLIFINTKNIPEKNFQSFSISGGYNTVTTGKEKTGYKGGKLDWLGIDDGTRALPSTIPAQEDYPVAISAQATQAKNLVNNWALTSGKFAPNFNFQYATGHHFKKRYTDSLGNKGERELFGMMFSVTYSKSNNLYKTERNAWTNSTDINVPSQIDETYIDNAYSSQILTGAIANFSAKLSDNNRIGFKNIYSINSDDRAIVREGTINPLDVNPTLLRSVARWFTGNRIYSGQLNGEHLLKKSKIKMDWIASYSNVNREMPDLRRSIYTRWKYIQDPNDPNPADTVYQANISISSVGPSYGGNIFNSKTKESIQNLRYDVSRTFTFGKNRDTIPDTVAVDRSLLAKGKSSWGQRMKLNRQIRKNDRKVHNSELKNNNLMEIKIGAYYQSRQREFTSRLMGLTRYQVAGGGVPFDFNLLYLPEDQIFANENMGLMANGMGGFKLVDATKPNDKYNAQSMLYAGYAMTDYHFKHWLRAIVGVRYEHFTQELEAKYDNGKPLQGTVEDPKALVTTKADLLPSANIVFSPSSKQNIRLCYSQTLNRPEFRELAPFAFYDFNTQFLYSGNDQLTRALIHNYDLRYEFYPGRGQLFSLTVFNKDFINPIEQISRADVTNEVSFANVPKARNTGGEIEFRVLLASLFRTDSVKLLNNLTLYSNFAYIDSRVTLSNNANTTIRYRQLQGQSPYVFNAGIMYQNKKGWSANLAANRVGQRIAIVGNANEPNIWENARTVMDFQIAKTIETGEAKKNKADSTAAKPADEKVRKKTKMEIRFNIRDGLAQKQIFYQDRDENKKLNDKDDVLWTTYFGRTFSLSFNYKF